MAEKDLRALDAYIAEHVMGWRVIKGRKFSFDDPKVAALTGEVCLYIVGKHPDLWRWDGEESYAWRPTTDPVAALQVFEVVCGAYIPVQITGPSAESRSKWKLESEHYGPVEAHTLPLAICLYAKAVHVYGRCIG